jgi:hypothetical protein
MTGFGAAEIECSADGCESVTPSITAISTPANGGSGRVESELREQLRQLLEHEHVAVTARSKARGRA